MKVAWATYGERGFIRRSSKTHLRGGPFRTRCGIELPVDTSNFYAVGDRIYVSPGVGNGKCKRCFG